MSECRECGEQFTGKSKAVKICSKKCRDERNARSRKKTSEKWHKSEHGKNWMKKYYKRPEVIQKTKSPEMKKKKHEYYVKKKEA